MFAGMGMSPGELRRFERGHRRRKESYSVQPFHPFAYLLSSSALSFGRDAEAREAAASA